MMVQPPEISQQCERQVLELGGPIRDSPQHHMGGHGKGRDHPQFTHLRDAVLMGHHTDDVVQWEQGVTLDLSVDVLALSAHSQELDQVDVVHEGAVLIHAVPLRPHHLDERLERGSVIVEHEDVLSRVHQLQKEWGLFVGLACRGGDCKEKSSLQRKRCCVTSYLPKPVWSVSLNSSRFHLFIFLNNGVSSSVILIHRYRTITKQL